MPKASPQGTAAEERPPPAGQPPPPPPQPQVHPAAAARAYIAVFEGREKPYFVQLAEKVMEPLLQAAEAIPMKPQVRLL